MGVKGNIFAPMATRNRRNTNSASDNPEKQKTVVPERYPLTEKMREELALLQKMNKHRYMEEFNRKCKAVL